MISMVVKEDTCICMIISVNRTTRMVHVILASNLDHSSSPNLQRTASRSPRKSHRLDIITEHHTSIYAIINKVIVELN
jgi:hypothetical protein